MRTLPRDPRGYPIPYLVMIDKRRQPQFTINDVRRALECDRKGLCAICGKRLERVGTERVQWFVGGSRCFLHEHGAFLDPPMHLDCATYALRVCPFLAARRYTGRIDAAKPDPDAIPDGLALARHDGVLPALPERFGLGLAESVTISRDRAGAATYSVPRWRYVEFWRAGEPIDAPDTGEPPPTP